MKRILILTAAILLTCLQGFADDGQKEMDAFISQLMAKMTVEEKLGQMNLLPGTSATTGELKDSPLAKLIAEGKTTKEIGKQLGMKPEEVFRLSDFSKEEFIRMMDSAPDYSRAVILTKV